jgi:hypothetical protein
MGIDYQSGAIYIFLSFYRPQSRLPWQLFFIFAVKKWIQQRHRRLPD